MGEKAEDGWCIPLRGSGATALQVWGGPSLLRVRGGDHPLYVADKDGHRFSRKHCPSSQGGYYGVGDLKGPLLGTLLDGIMGKI